MTVEALMTRKVTTYGDASSLADVARLMWQHDIGFLPVVGSSGGALLLGVITDRDICMAAWLQGKPLTEISVRSAMAQPAVCCAPQMDLYEAECLMRKHQVHRLPVVSNGALIGVLSLNDLARRNTQERDERLEENVAETLAAIATPRR